MHPIGRITEQGGLLLQINADAAKKNRHTGGLIILIQGQRKVHGGHDDRVTLLAQSRDEGIIAQTGAAKHFAGARRQLDYSQRLVAGHRNSRRSVLFRRRDDNERVQGWWGAYLTF